MSTLAELFNVQMFFIYLSHLNYGYAIYTGVSGKHWSAYTWVKNLKCKHWSGFYTGVKW